MRTVRNETGVKGRSYSGEQRVAFPPLVARMQVEGQPQSKHCLPPKEKPKFFMPFDRHACDFQVDCV